MISVNLETKGNKISISKLLEDVFGNEDKIRIVLNRREQEYKTKKAKNKKQKKKNKTKKTPKKQKTKPKANENKHF